MIRCFRSSEMLLSAQDGWSIQVKNPVIKTSMNTDK